MPILGLSSGKETLVTKFIAALLIALTIAACSTKPDASKENGWMGVWLGQHAYDAP